MMDVNRTATNALNFPRTRRNHPVAVLTSLPAGKCVPLAAIPLLREDSLRGSLSVSVEMGETGELLVNPVNLRLTAYLVPHLALARFDGSRDQLDRSYAGQPAIDGGAVVPFIETQAAGAYGANPILKYMGLHAKSTDQINTAYIEAYNLIWNMRAKNRSKGLTPRARLLNTLAPAFWYHQRFEHIVPDFDQAVIDGEVALNVVATRLPVSGIGVKSGSLPTAAVTDAGNPYRQSLGTGGAYVIPDQFADTGVAGKRWSNPLDAGNRVSVKLSDDLQRPEVFAELQANGITVSLSNIEMARKTQAFAKLRMQFDGIADEYIIDMLMGGVSIPEQALKQPILLADQMVAFAQAKRYATDAANLAESAVSGGARATLNLRVPRLNTGGVVMVIAEALPEQLFERSRDPYLHTTSVASWPEALKDTLDPEKVDVVKNGEIDTEHATPNATFGYEPLNGKWNRFGPRVGGKFLRPSTDAGTDIVRQRLWAQEPINPALNTDFFTATTLHTKPFLDTAVDPFEASVGGNCVIEGNTQFGGLLVEASVNYDKVELKQPTARIVKA